MQHLSIKEAALQVEVSENTIRNWIKTGDLKSPRKGWVTTESVTSFIKNIAGKEKLNARANKLFKDKHTTPQRLLQPESDFESLGKQYEHLLSESHKNKEGVYYTPDYIIQDMLADLSAENLADKKFLDPCCGTGNFIIKALEIGFKPENIYGFDIDSNAVQITINRIFNKTGYQTQQIIHADFLEVALSLKVKFDYIFTNPPWGKKFKADQKEKYAQMYKSGKSLDSSSLFVFASLAVLKNKGTLGFLLPDSFFNISIFQDVRSRILNLHIKKLTDYGKAFKGLMPRAQAVVLTNQNIPEKVKVICRFKNKQYFREQESFINNPKSIINFGVEQSGMEVVSHVLSLPHLTLLGTSKWGLGIVTGNNKRHLAEQTQKGYMPVYRGTDIYKGSIKIPTSFIPEDVHQFQQAAPRELYQAPEKIIYRFISSQLHFYFDNQQKYCLNSANFFILDEGFPISGSQLCDLLNSDFMTWFFQSIFSTHKILKADLQTLPIHIAYFEAYKEFCETKYLKFLSVSKTEQGYRLIK